MKKDMYVPMNQLIKDKETSLDLAYHAFMNGVPYSQQVPRAFENCQTAIHIWQAWEEDLIKYLEDNNE